MINNNSNNIHLEIAHNKRPDTVVELKIKEFGEGLLQRNIFECILKVIILLLSKFWMLKINQN